MYPEPQHLVTVTELWLQSADAHDLLYVDAGKSFHDFARYYCATSVAYHELLAPDPPGTTSCTHQTVANTTRARALHIEDALGRRGEELDFYVDPVQALDPEERIVPRHPTPETGGEWKSIATGAAHPEVTHPHDSPTTGLRP